MTLTKNQIAQIARNPRFDLYKPEKIIEKISKKGLMKIEKVMLQKTQINVLEFLRLFIQIYKQEGVKDQDEIYLAFGLLKLFKDLCQTYKKSQISFSQISSLMTQKMPAVNQQIIVKEKLLPVQLQIPQKQKMKIIPPEIHGKMMHQRKFLNKNPTKFDKFQHVNRCISRCEYSKKNQMFMSIDSPSIYIRILDKNFNTIKNLKSELDISRKDAMVNYVVWSQKQQRLGCLLGNFSLSFWSKQDDFRFQVNVPLPTKYLINPFVILGYMESVQIWYAIDNRPEIYILSSYNFQPIHIIKNFKMIKQKETQKLMTAQLKYRKLLCLAFERKLFLVSLSTRQVISQLNSFSTSLTSITFSESFQALITTTYQNYFKAFQLSEYCDLTQKGRFQGHKHQVVLAGVLESKPVVYSLQENSTMKLWDIRDFTCYQTFNVLKNILYQQMFTVNDGIILVGSKLYFYPWIEQKQFIETYEINQASSLDEKIILISSIQKNILIVSNKMVKLYSNHDGGLTQVIKGIFDTIDIYFAFHNFPKKQLYLSTEQGETVLYQTQQFNKIHSFKLLPRPMYFNFTSKSELMTICAMGEIHISQWMQEKDFQLKRRIFNKKNLLKFAQVSSFHDLIISVYEKQFQKQKNKDQLDKNIKTQSEKHPDICSNQISTDNIFFYSFQRGKALGFLTVKLFVTLYLHPTMNLIIVLLKHKIQFYTYQKKLSGVTFILKYQLRLWQGQLFSKALTQNFLQFVKISKIQIENKFMSVYQNQIIVISNYSCLFCKIPFKIQDFHAKQIVQSEDNYNPLRIAVQNHEEAFDLNMPSKVQDLSNKNQIYLKPLYQQNKYHAFSIFCTKIGDILIVGNDKKDIHFYDQKLMPHGIINFNLTLPKIWDLYWFQNNQIKEIQFVLQFLQRQKHTQTQVIENSSSLFDLTLAQLSKQDQKRQKNKEILTIQKILQMNGQNIEKCLNSPLKTHKSCSLRQRKLILQKQREERERLQDYLQHKQIEQLHKQIQTASKDNQGIHNDIINFFSINRNQNIKKKGFKQKEYPNVKALQKKLMTAVKDQKKSIVSKISNVYSSNPKMKMSQSIMNLPQRKTLINDFQSNNDSQSPYKLVNKSTVAKKSQLMKRLNADLQNSKMVRNGKSLPTIKQKRRQIQIYQKQQK